MTTTVQFFFHMYDVKDILELAGVKSFKCAYVGGGSKKEIDRFLEKEQVDMVAGMARRVFSQQRGGFPHSQKNKNYKVFKRPVIVSVAINGKLVSNAYMVLAEDGLQGEIARMNREQVRIMKKMITQAHKEIKAAYTKHHL